MANHNYNNLVTQLGQLQALLASYTPVNPAVASEVQAYYSDAVLKVQSCLVTLASAEALDES